MSEACIGDDEHVHNVCDCSPSCISRCIRRGSSNCEHWVLKFIFSNALRTDQVKVFGSKLIKEMFQLLGIAVTPFLPYKPEGRGLKGPYNDKVTK